jgi:DNA-binding protein H-NS
MGKAMIKLKEDKLMPIDISGLNMLQLKELKSNVEAAILTKQTEGKAALIKQMEEMAAAEGFTLAELSGPKASKAKAEAAEPKERAPVAIKYRDPNEPNNTWTGRGRSPKWLVEFEAKGGKREDALV